jgi:creatinine amidohydrolase/Fe(II)-dependent formamide hydrolase-like protein
LLASLVSDKLAERNGWISLPPINYSIAVPARIGNVDISTSTFGNYLGEILQHLSNFGQRSFILILGHGGPDMKSTIEGVCKKLCEEEDITIQAFHTLRVLEDLKLVDQREDRHAGMWETSLMLVAHPELVGDTEIYKDSESLREYAVFGDPTMATRENGEHSLRRVLERIEDDLRESADDGFMSNWGWTHGGRG